MDQGAHDSHTDTYIEDPTNGVIEESPLAPLLWWFSGTSRNCHNRWFQANPAIREKIDAFIVTHFSEYLVEAEEYDINSEINSINTFNIYTTIQRILVLDQFSRHIYRNDRDDGNGRNCETNKISRNTQKAVELTCQLLRLSSLDDVIGVDDVRAFILMPLKHHDTEKYYSLMMTYLKKWNYMESGILMRFWKDLVKRYSKIQNQKVEICEPFLKTPDFESITEYCPKEFYSWDWNQWTTIQEMAKKTVIGKEVRVRLEKLDNLPPLITVSLSGGVDSMVLVCALKLYEKQYGYHLQAVHLNYRNRLVSDEEAKFVHFYCSKLNVPLYIRVIDEIHRKTGESDRTFYEQHTRNIRFGMYQKVSEINGISGISGIIVLGHMHDDVIENIWTNFARGRDLFHLQKMDILCEQDSVRLWRPLLHVEKTDILSFAQQFHIAFLLNTTPAWSNRGKFRTDFLPAVNQQYGEHSAQNVEFMANTLNEYHIFLEKQLFQPFLDNVVENRFGIQFVITENIIGMGMHFWQTVLGKLFHERGFSLPSRKSLDLMINVINNVKTLFKTKSYIMLTLKSQLFVRMVHQNNQFIMYILEKAKILDSGIVDCPSEAQLGIKYWRQIKSEL